MPLCLPLSLSVPSFCSHPWLASRLLDFYWHSLATRECVCVCMCIFQNSLKCYENQGAFAAVSSEIRVFFLESKSSGVHAPPVDRRPQDASWEGGPAVGSVALGTGSACGPRANSQQNRVLGRPRDRHPWRGSAHRTLPGVSASPLFR